MGGRRSGPVEQRRGELGKEDLFISGEGALTTPRT